MMEPKVQTFAIILVIVAMLMIKCIALPMIEIRDTPTETSAGNKTQTNSEIVDKQLTDITNYFFSTVLPYTILLIYGPAKSLLNSCVTRYLDDFFIFGALYLFPVLQLISNSDAEDKLWRLYESPYPYFTVYLAFLLFSFSIIMAVTHTFTLSFLFYRKILARLISAVKKKEEKRGIRMNICPGKSHLFVRERLFILIFGVSLNFVTWILISFYTFNKSIPNFPIVTLGFVTVAGPILLLLSLITFLIPRTSSHSFLIFIIFHVLYMFFWFSNIANSGERNNKWVSFVLSISVGRMVYYVLSKDADIKPDSLFNRFNVELKQLSVKYKKWVGHDHYEEWIKHYTACRVNKYDAAKYDEWRDQYKKWAEDEKKDEKKDEKEKESDKIYNQWCVQYEAWCKENNKTILELESEEDINKMGDECKKWYEQYKRFIESEIKDDDEHKEWRTHHESWRAENEMVKKIEDKYKDWCIQHEKYKKNSDVLQPDNEKKGVISDDKYDEWCFHYNRWYNETKAKESKIGRALKFISLLILYTIISFVILTSILPSIFL